MARIIQKYQMDDTSPENVKKQQENEKFIITEKMVLSKVENATGALLGNVKTVRDFITMIEGYENKMETPYTPQNISEKMNSDIAKNSTPKIENKRETPSTSAKNSTPKNSKKKMKYGCKICKSTSYCALKKTKLMAHLFQDHVNFKNVDADVGRKNALKQFAYKCNRICKQSQ